MKREKNYIAVDLGAESGRVMTGRVGNQNLSLTECHRFINSPVEEAGTLRWDFSKLLSEVKSSIAKAVKISKGAIAGIGIDTWGVDFGLIDKRGELIEKPYHYRDSRTDGMMEKAFDLMDKREIYENTGIQFMQLNTVYQLLSIKLNDPEKLTKVKHLMFMPDLFSYYLCGEIFSEYTQASTSQLMDMKTGQWAKVVFDKLDLPISIMPRIIRPATVVGKLKRELAAELGCGQIPVIAVGAHDTASAIAAVPAQEKNWAYLSSGTWSLMGIEIGEAIINDQTYVEQFTNEGGVEGSICFLKNIMGLWLVQECRRQWQREGTDMSYGEITAMAKKTAPFAAYVDPDYNTFLTPGDMPAKINSYLAQTGQEPIEDKGQMIRVILESLALKYREVLGKLETVLDNSIDVLHIVGGGIKNELLCQFTADATGKKVITGPMEATASGNIIIQAIAAGQVESLAQGRQIVRNCFELKEYLPRDTQAWGEAFKKIAKR